MARHEDVVNSISFSPNGQYLASGSGDGLVKVFEYLTGREVKVLRGHNKSVFSVNYSQDGKLIASGSVDKTVRLWDA